MPDTRGILRYYWIYPIYWVYTGTFLDSSRKIYKPNAPDILGAHRYGRICPTYGAYFGVTGHTRYTGYIFRYLSLIRQERSTKPNTPDILGAHRYDRICPTYGASFGILPCYSIDIYRHSYTYMSEKSSYRSRQCGRLYSCSCGGGHRFPEWPLERARKLNF